MMKILATVTAILIGLAIAGALAWNAAEAHYQSCVDAARALPNRNEYRDRLRAQYRGHDPHAEAVWQRVQDCSRSPL